MIQPDSGHVFFLGGAPRSLLGCSTVIHGGTEGGYYIVRIYSHSSHDTLVILSPLDIPILYTPTFFHHKSHHIPIVTPTKSRFQLYSLGGECRAAGAPADFLFRTEDIWRDHDYFLCFTYTLWLFNVAIIICIYTYIYIHTYCIKSHPEKDSYIHKTQLTILARN